MMMTLKVDMLLLLVSIRARGFSSVRPAGARILADRTECLLVGKEHGRVVSLGRCAPLTSCIDSQWIVDGSLVSPLFPYFFGFVVVSKRLDKSLYPRLGIYIKSSFPKNKVSSLQHNPQRPVDFSY
ncbi:hypothetical protein J3459_011821 [Metarhizium acridum]|nr:hypothetical protein J3459_011821 [Metarhizium acridum]